MTKRDIMTALINAAIHYDSDPAMELESMRTTRRNSEYPYCACCGFVLLDDSTEVYEFDGELVCGDCANLALWKAADVWQDCRG